jgi:SAM-dependent methyltransferase
MNRKRHWEALYHAKTPEQMAWHQATPRLSLDMIAAAALPYTAAIVDVGGGASTLVDHLLDEGYLDVTVLDIAANSLAAAQARLGARAEDVTWLAADILQAELPQRYDVWHDRALFHFLADPAERARYMAAARAALKENGHLIVATFAPDGPTRCADLDVVRFAPEQLCETVGPGFYLVSSELRTHVTPWNSHQQFLFCHFHRHG